MSLEEKSLSAEEVEKFLRTAGKSGVNTLSILGRTYPFFDTVINTEIGKELLKDAVNRVDILLQKVLDITISDEEKGELKFLRETLLPNWGERINKYLSRIDRVKSVAAKAA